MYVVIVEMCELVLGCARADCLGLCLCLSLSIDQNDIVLFLCTLGVDVNVRDSDRQTPLHNAVRNRNLEAIKILLAHHADRTLVDIYRRTPADWAQTDPEVYLALTGESLSVNAHAAAAADDAGTAAAAGSTPSSEAGKTSTVASSASTSASSAGDAAQVAMLSRALLQLQEQHQQRSNEFKYQLIATQKEVGELKARVVELERLVSAFQLIIKHNHGHSDISS